MKGCLILMLVLLVQIVFSQNPLSVPVRYFGRQITTNGYRFCGTHIRHIYNMQHDSSYNNSYNQTQDLIKNILNEGLPKISGPYTIPVVVHVIHLGEPIGTGTNISDVQIQSAITALNDDYRKITGTNGDGNGVDTEIEFCLASTDPNGNFTTGINRVNGTGIGNYENVGIDLYGGNNQVVLGLSYWPSSDYYNIWIVTEIEGNDAGAGIQGFAQLPGGTPSTDGAIILYNSFGTVGNLKPGALLNRVATHEIGHGLGLLHTFENTVSCSSETDCTTQGDYCCDTPPHPGDSTHCNPDCMGAQQVENYMDYTDETCMNMFTQDQKDRMLATLLGPRSSLLSSSGCVMPDTCSNPFTIQSTIDSINCFGLYTGSISLSITGGTPPFNYSWLHGAGTSSVSGLPDGDYSVTVTDAMGCAGSETYHVSQPPDVALTVNSSPASCATCADGGVGVSISGGTPPYTYHWWDGSTNLTLSGLSPDSYYLDIVDANGCNHGQGVPVGNLGDTTFVKVLMTATSEYYGGIVNTSDGNFLCSGIDYQGTPDKIVMSKVNRNGDLLWNNKLVGGVHFGLVKEENKNMVFAGNNGSDLHFLKTDSLGVPILSRSYGLGTWADKGLVSLTNSGGYLLTGRTLGNPVSAILLKLDQNGDTLWTRKEEKTVVGPAIELMDGSVLWVRSTSDTVNNRTDATILKLNQNGDTLWTSTYAMPENESFTSIKQLADSSIIAFGGTGSYQDFDMLESLILLKVDKNGNKIWSKIIVSDYYLLTCYESMTIDSKGNILMAGDSYDALNNWEEYAYFIKLDSSGNLLFSKHYNIHDSEYFCSVSEISGAGYMLTGGTFQQGNEQGLVIRTDINGNTDCYSSDMNVELTNMNTHPKFPVNQKSGLDQRASISWTNVVVGEVDSTICSSYCNLQLAVNSVDESCPGLNDGTINLTVLNASGQVSYYLNGNQSAQSITGLDAGKYYISVVDSIGCSVRDSIEIKTFELSITKTDVQCYGMSNGVAVANVSGGISPYTYSWDSGTGNQVTDSAVNLIAGTYLISVSDQNNCVITDSVAISEPLPIRLKVITTDSLCGSNYSSAQVTVVLGNVSSYQWSNGDTMSYTSNLSNGTYYVYVSNNNGCTAMDSAIITGALAQQQIDTMMICIGDSALIYGVYENMEGRYYDTLITSNGCDSILTTELIHYSVDTAINVVGITLTANEANANYQWYAGCGTTIVDSATYQSFTPIANGNYVVYIYQNGCVYESSCISITTVNVSEISNSSSEISVYPNPSSGKFKIKIRDPYDELIWSISDGSGKVIMMGNEKNNQKISVSYNLATGVYYLKLKLDGIESVFKLFVI